MIKQTQTKLFDFSDVGLDFSAGSKNLFPDRFKKMLALGYNPQTASSVSIAGDQVTLTYGVTHGYVADRVLQVTAAGGYSKEVYINSVTASTITFTDATATGLTGLISTKVASLGWELVYELANIHIYKLKKLDETDTYLRVCFQNNVNARNCLIVGVGDTVNLTTGVITDARCMPVLAQATSPNQESSMYRWEFGGLANATHNSATYSSGLATYGKGMIVGSKYHLISLHNIWLDSLNGNVCAALPMQTSYNDLKIHALFTNLMGDTGSNIAYSDLLTNSVIIAGVYVCRANSRESKLFATSDIKGNFLPSALDDFNTTTTRPIFVYENVTGQLVGGLFGMHQAMYGDVTGAPSRSPQSSPSISADVDLISNVVVHSMSQSSNAVWFAAPIEEIKIVS